MASRRSRRSENFSEEENCVLLHEYKARQEQLNDPDKRKLAWLTISSLVSAVTGIKRTIDQCRRKITNLKHTPISSATSALPEEVDAEADGHDLRTREPADYCLFCSQSVNLQNNLTLSEDLVISLCRILNLKSTRGLNFEENLLNCSMCSTCHEKVFEAQLVLEELEALQRRMESISTDIEKLLVMGFSSTKTVVETSSSLSATTHLSAFELRQCIVNALKLDIPSYSIDEGEGFPSVSSVEESEADVNHLQFEDRLESKNSSLHSDEEVETPAVNSWDCKTDLFHDDDDNEMESFFGPGDISDVKLIVNDQASTEAAEPHDDGDPDSQSHVTTTASQNFTSNLNASFKDILDFEIFGGEDATELTPTCRTKNFTDRETKAFLVEYEKRKSILSATGPGKPSNDIKLNLWSEIAAIVSSIEGVHRTIDQCKKKYSQLKTNCCGDLTRKLQSLSHIEYVEPEEPAKEINASFRDHEKKFSKEPEQFYVEAEHFSELDEQNEMEYRRTKNYTKRGLKALLMEYQKRSGLLEAPRRHPSSDKQRRLQLWSEIAKIVSSIDGTPRNIDQCKKKILDLKLRNNGDLSTALLGLSDVYYHELQVTAEESPQFNPNQNSRDISSYEIFGGGEGSNKLIAKEKDFSEQETKAFLVEYEKRKDVLEGPESETSDIKLNLWAEIAALVSSVEGLNRGIRQCKKKLQDVQSSALSEQLLESLSHIDYEESELPGEEILARFRGEKKPGLGCHDNLDTDDCSETNSKFRRNKNFSQLEIKALIMAYEKRKPVLEGPGPIKSREKLILWAEIAAIVSSVEGTLRSVEQCKKKFSDLKCRGNGDPANCLASLSHIDFDESKVNVDAYAIYFNQDSNGEIFEENSDLTPKRRSNNFSHREIKAILIEYDKRKSILSNETENSDKYEKHRLWCEIAAIVSSVDGEERSVPQCKKKLLQLKYRSNDDLSSYLLSLSHIEDEAVSEPPPPVQQVVPVPVLERGNVLKHEYTISVSEDSSKTTSCTRRAKNFTRRELKAFIIEYQKRKEDLQGPGCPDYDEKLNLWSEIARIVSSVEGTNRSAEQCKKKFTDLKSRNNGDISMCLADLSDIKYDGVSIQDDIAGEPVQKRFKSEHQENEENNRRMHTRAKNFTPTEVKVLLDEYEKRKLVIKLHSKDKTPWEEIAAMVVAVRGHPRTVEQCKKRVDAELGRLHRSKSCDPDSSGSGEEYQVEENEDDSDEDYKPVKKEAKGKAKRRRFFTQATVPFSPDEVNALICEYKNHKEFRDSHTRLNMITKQLWKSISSVVSQTSGIHRSAEQCWKKLRNLEYSEKAKESIYQKYTAMSREGPVQLKVLKLRLFKCDDPDYQEKLAREKASSINFELSSHARFVQLRQKARTRHLKLRYAANTKPQRTNDNVQAKRLARQQQLINMFRVKRVKQVFKCTFPECAASFLRANQRNVHYKREHQEQIFSFKCLFPECRKAFRTAVLLEEHVQVHDGQVNLCDICQKSFDTERGLRRHKFLVHRTGAPVEMSRFPCTVCTREFANARGLDKHFRRVHNKERPYLCELCSRTFPSKVELRNHQAISHPEIPEFETNKFTCDECGRVMSSESYLRLHKLRHKNALPYKCTHPGCNFQACRPANLKLHLIIHSEERNFKCPQCDKTYKRTAQLRSHMHRHAGTGRVPCKYCDKSFAESKNLKNHVAVVHFPDQKRYICASCGEGFSVKKYLDRHLIICAEGLSGTSRRNSSKRVAVANEEAAEVDNC